MVERKDRKATREEIINYIKEEKEGLVAIEDVANQLHGKNRMSIAQLEAREKYFKKKVASWESIKHAYIFGVWNEELQQTIYPKIPEMAEALGINEKTIYSRAGIENWDTFKTLFKQKALEKAEREELRNLLSESARYDQVVLENLERVIGICTNKLKKAGKENVRIDEYGVRHEGKEVEEISARDLKVITDTLVIAREQAREIIGEDKTLEAVANEIEKIKQLDAEKGSNEVLKKLKQEAAELEKEREKYRNLKRKRTGEKREIRGSIKNEINENDLNKSE